MKQERYYSTLDDSEEEHDGDNHEHDGEENKRPRLRLARACDRCKRRKIKVCQSGTVDQEAQRNDG